MSSLLSLLVLNPKCRKLALRFALLLYLIVLIGGSIPGARSDLGQWASGLVLHGCTYSCLTFLLFIGFEGSIRQKAFQSLLSIAAMGAIDEGIQSFLPYRSGSVIDWLVDMNAALLSLALLWMLWPVQPLSEPVSDSAQDDTNQSHS